MLSSILEEDSDIIPSNLHIHTPYSFSAFTDISEAVRLAREQGVLILGISDFNTTEGYRQFTEECSRYIVFPAYGMEVMALSLEDQKSGRRWNDPNNPGRIYFCGKGFQYPLVCSQRTVNKLEHIMEFLDNQIRQMIDKLNDHLSKTLPDINLSYNHIKVAGGTIRERHIAKALQQALSKLDLPERAAALKALYGKESQIDINDGILLQEELRSNLLKAGKVAFVEEKRKAYLSLDEARSVMLDMGGIPCYPVLLDGTKGDLTEFEKDPESLCNELICKGIYCAEFIPTRNDISLLRDYVSVFNSKGLIVTAGTEHNTPKMEPMEPRCRGGVEFDEMLKETFWKGACVVAAHQYLVKNGRSGYVDSSGNRTDNDINELAKIGKSVIAHYLHRKVLEI